MLFGNLWRPLKPPAIELTRASGSQGSQGGKAPFDSLFVKIMTKDEKVRAIYEDDVCIAFHDKFPQGPTHIVVLPKGMQVPRLSEVQKDDCAVLGHLLYVAGQVANTVGISDSGWRLVINDKGKVDQSVFHVHCHVIGGRKLLWPPG